MPRFSFVKNFFKKIFFKKMLALDAMFNYTIVVTQGANQMEGNNVQEQLDGKMV